MDNRWTIGILLFLSQIGYAHAGSLHNCQSPENKRDYSNHFCPPGRINPSLIWMADASNSGNKKVYTMVEFVGLMLDKFNPTPVKNFLGPPAAETKKGNILSLYYRIPVELEPGQIRYPIVRFENKTYLGADFLFPKEMEEAIQKLLKSK